MRACLPVYLCACSITPARGLLSLATHGAWCRAAVWEAAKAPWPTAPIQGIFTISSKPPTSRMLIPRERRHLCLPACPSLLLQLLLFFLGGGAHLHTNTLTLQLSQSPSSPPPRLSPLLFALHSLGCLTTPGQQNWVLGLLRSKTFAPTGQWHQASNPTVVPVVKQGCYIQYHRLFQVCAMYCAVLCCAVLCCAVLCCAVLCCLSLCVRARTDTHTQTR